MPTPDMFDFDTYRLADYDPARVRKALREHPAIYVNHLEVAQWIEGWAERLEPYGGDSSDDSDFVKALREVIAPSSPGGPRARRAAPCRYGRGP
jgi:hypothetical protein